MSRTAVRWIAVALLGLVSASACDALEANDAARTTDGPVIVATTSVMGELVTGVVGDGAAVEVLVPGGADPHAFRFSDLDVETARSADLVVAVGGGYEPGLPELLAELDPDTRVFVGVEHLDEPIETQEGVIDPHFWHDPVAMGEVARALGDALGDVEPQRSRALRAAARDYALELLDLSFDVEELLRPVPELRRALVTQHDFFRYLARRYDMSVLGAVVPGLSSSGEPSASARVSLVAAMQSQRVCAIFTPETSAETLSAIVAREVEGEVQVVRVHAESVDGDLGYAETMRENARRLTTALTQCG